MSILRRIKPVKAQKRAGGNNCLKNWNSQQLITTNIIIIVAEA
jgi:hypothetical protein